MPVELRKRKAIPDPPPPTKKRAPPPSKAKKDSPKTENAQAVGAPADDPPAAEAPAADEPAKAAAKGGAPTVGTITALEGFGGEVETNAGDTTTLANLVAESEKGVVLFTYPKASTPGCTKQVCFFRDAYDQLSDAGWSVYGLSTDSPKANSNFKDKQKLPYTLLCDPAATLIGAIGLKKPPKSTTRGVFVVDKSGKVLAAEPGSPEGTLKVVQKVMAGLDGNANGLEKAGEQAGGGGTKAADVVAAIADGAEKVDGTHAKL